MLDIEYFRESNPIVLAPDTDLNKIRYSDLQYSTRIKALLDCTLDAGKPLSMEKFNDLLNGRRTLAEVIALTNA